MTQTASWSLDTRAIVSAWGVYRYWLRRRIAPAGRPVVFCLLNPTLAEDMTDDPALRRCLAYARSWDMGELAVINLFACRVSDPALLFDDGVPDPVGPLNDAITLAAAKFCSDNNGLFVCAWGSAGKAQRHRLMVASRSAAVRRLVQFQGVTPHYLRLSAKTGQPDNPLTLPAHLTPTPWL